MIKLSVRHAAVALALLVPGCAAEEKKDVPTAIPGTEGEPDGLVVSPPALPGVVADAAPGAAGGRGGTVTLPNGGQVHTLVIDGKVYVPIEATFSERSWQSILGRAHGQDRVARDLAVKKELEAVFAKISQQARVVGADILPTVGWASAYVPLEAYGALAGITGIGRRLLVNPVITTPMERAERDLKRDSELGFAASSAFTGLEDLVGLSRMGISGFLTKAAADLEGYRPNGSHVLLGVVDTGITLNHPAFHDAAGASRITSIKDFTGEGRIFFSPTARFEVKPGENDALNVSADFLASPKANYESPDPAVLEKIENQPLLLPPALKKLLEAPNASGAKFGVLDEASFGKAAGGIDLDHNGKTDDRFYAILVPGQNGEPDAVWLALAEKGDFRQSPRLTDFNGAHETQSVWAEKIGLQIKNEKILDGKGAEVPVTTASVVGYDPGSHGSHVTGIAAARKIFANSPDDTELHGVAPLAQIAFGRVCANTGGCFATKAIADLSDGGARVINMSIGSLGPDNDGYGVQETVIDRLTVTNGTVFVVAASNDGPGRQTVGSPSVSRYGISVAATASQKILQAQYHYPGSGKIPSMDPGSEDFLLYFSSRGPTAAGAMKPDISAPGTWLSAIQLNASPGAASGLDVMWGTSMASPATAGAVTLLLDAALVYNEKHPTSPVAIDGRTIRKVLLASARPFDATTLDTRTQAKTQGQYTWIDEGFGMVNVERAWELLKQERAARLAAPVTYSDGTGKHEVPLDYQVRVLARGPNGLAYDGSVSIAGAGDQPEAKFGRGLWVDAKGTGSNYGVQVARRLPSDVVARPDVGALAAQLLTTADQFELETTIHGSHLAWVRPGALDGPDCASVAPNAALPRMLVIGEGATDIPVDPTTGKGGSVAQSTSLLHLCINRALVDLLPAGDHGAIVTAYRVIGAKREAVPSFVVPVYLTVPHKTLAGAAGLHVASNVGSFGVARHYIDVPKGTTIVKVNVTVPPATQTGTAVTGCSGIMLEALEGANTAIPVEFQKKPSDAIALNCYNSGQRAPDDWRTVSLVRTAPKAGIWDLHIFGMYGYTSSAYAIDVEFAKVTSTLAALEGPAAVLQNTFNVEVVDASYALKISKENSTFSLNGFTHDRPSQATRAETTTIPDAAGAIARAYAADVGTVTIATGQSPGNDLDLEVAECDDAAMKVCKPKASSGGPADTETVTFTPAPGKFYVASVVGYAVTAGEGKFVMTESLGLTTPERGKLEMTQPSDKLFTFVTSYDVGTSRLLVDPRHTTGGYALHGRVDVKDDASTVIIRLPVKVSVPAQ